jgi:copper chaperone CopZ
MKSHSVEIHQENMQCQQCLNEIVNVLSQVHTIEYLDINIAKKLIRLKYKDNDLNDQKIKYLINNAINSEST